MNVNENNINISYLRQLANRHFTPLEDVLLIAVNRYGICADVPDKRLRFKLKLDTLDELFYMAVCVNTYPSPFRMETNGDLTLRGDKVGVVIDVEEDTCDTTYFRRNKTELTLNSNMRSQCEGCTFCGTYNLEPEDRIDMSDTHKMTEFVHSYLQANSVKDLSDLVRITLCTGCFADENNLADHLLMVYEVFSKFGFDKRIRYIGSQIRSENVMDKIRDNIPYFSLSLTVECFSKREERMRKEKASLNFEMIRKVLGRALNHGFSTNYLYITGLDSLETMRAGMLDLVNLINRLPVIQIMQNFAPVHEEERVEEAKELSYYLEARKLIERIFDGKPYGPRSWENYRGLFYTAYQNKPLRCVRI